MFTSKGLGKAREESLEDHGIKKYETAAGLTINASVFERGRP
jgi:predicted flap endonuclease-1-like 5' DNA nuclease